MMKNDNNILSLRIKQIEFLNPSPPRHRKAQQEVEQSICECLNWEAKRLHCLESDWRGQYFCWPGHGDVTQCHGVTINNTNVTLSDGQILSRYCQAESPFIDCSGEWAPRLPEVHLTESRSERLCQCSVSFHWQWSIKCQDSESTCPVSQVPTWDASCLTSRLSQWPAILGADVWRVCVPACHSPAYLK